MLNKDDTLLNELLSDENLKIAKQRVKKNNCLLYTSDAADDATAV